MEHVMEKATLRRRFVAASGTQMPRRAAQRPSRQPFIVLRESAKATRLDGGTLDDPAPGQQGEIPFDLRELDHLQTDAVVGGIEGWVSLVVVAVIPG